MRSQERDSWTAQLEAERAERAKDRVGYLELADVVAKEHIEERERWTTQLEAERRGRIEERAHWKVALDGERTARAEAEAEFSKTITVLLERADRQEAAAREERAKLLDRIQAREPEREQEKPFYPPDGEVQEPPHTPEDLENYAHVGGIVPEGVKVGMDTPWPPPTYPQTPFANSEE